LPPVLPSKGGVFRHRVRRAPRPARPCPPATPASLDRTAYRQTCCHWQLPNELHTRSCRQEAVPIGGMVGGLIGATDGAIMGQTAGGQIGRRSMELLHKGCICPLTHWHVQLACACRTTATEAHPAGINAATTASPRLRMHSPPQPGVTCSNPAERAIAV
jgi:hypothetical protein